MTPYDPVMSKPSKTLINQALEWRALMDNDIVDSEDRQAFQAWVMADPDHMEAYDYAVRFWESLGELSDSHRARVGFNSETMGDDRRTSRFSKVRMASMAVVLTLFAFGILILPMGENEPPIKTERIAYETEVGETLPIELSDGSMLTLGPASEIRGEFDTVNRRITLTVGNAFFQVASDPERPFCVHSGSLDIQVTGTAFDVRRSDASAQVSVAEGEVRVSLAKPSVPSADGQQNGDNRSTSVLNSGQRISGSVTSGLGEITTINPETVGAWLENRLVFFDEPLLEIVNAVNRYDSRNIVIRDKHLEELRVSATFDANDIDSLLQTLAEIYPLRIAATGESHVLIVPSQ